MSINKLLNLLTSLIIVITFCLSPSLASAQDNDSVPETSDPNVLYVEQKGESNNKVKWHLKVNEANSRLKDVVIDMELQGGHDISLAELNMLLNAKGVTVTQPDPEKKLFLLNIKSLAEPLNVEFSSIITDNQQSNYKVLLSADINQHVTASDIYFVKTQLSGKVQYKDVPDKVTPTALEVELIDKQHQTVVDRTVVNPNYLEYTFDQLNKFNIDNQLIEYEVRPKATGNYKVDVKANDILLQYLSTKIEGNIRNESDKPLNIKIINKATGSIVDEVLVDGAQSHYTKDNLPLNDDQGNRIDYDIKVEDTEGFKATTSNFDIEVTKEKAENTHPENSVETKQDDQPKAAVKVAKKDEASAEPTAPPKTEDKAKAVDKAKTKDKTNETSAKQEVKQASSSSLKRSLVYAAPKEIPLLSTFSLANVNLLGFAPMNNVAGVADDPYPTYKGQISNMAWDEKGLYRNRTPQPVEYNESFQWKQAQPTSTENEYAIDLKTQGRASVTQETVDIVLVVDNSASMGTIIGNGKTRWQSMKDDVFQFIDEVTRANTAANTKIRIDVVNFASALRPEINSGFSGDPAVIKSKFYPSYVPSGQGGGTFTQQGLISGSNKLDTSRASKKVMVVLTDGAPTLSYKGISATGSENITSFSNYVKGDGSDFRLHGRSYYADHDPYFINRYIKITNHGQPTISQAKLIKNSRPDFDIFSIGLDTTVASGGATEEDMNNVLNNIASRPEYAFTTSDSASELSKTLSKISQNVSNSISNGVVTDPIGAMYDLNLGSDNIFDKSDYTLTASNPDLVKSVTVNYDPNTKTLKMNGLNLGKGEWVNLNYKVKLRVTDDNFVENQWYPMNGTTTLKPSSASINLREYPVPEAKAKSPSYNFVFNKVDDNEKPLQGAVFELKDVSGNTLSRTSSSSGQVLFDNLKKGRYTLTEKSAPNGFIKDSKVYTVVIASNGEIRIDNVLYTDTNKFKIINKKLLGSIEVIKHKTGNENELLPGAKFELRNSAGDLIGTLTTGPDGKVLFKALPLGNYTLKEVQAPKNYQLNSELINITVKNDEKVIVKVPNKSNSDILPNTGGTGTIFYTLLGLLIMVIAVWSRKQVSKP
ncbi:SpaA isopeptide-forming pilin-related protein [Macrococcus caseolyticus]|uniref:SpaA isopeptide-forming pilin-related protein n=1 Tax=Macrococcoides caseolyticum TaxID=69966 RepID=UPI002DBE1D37|nr:SpaA isopeptide-forming pilin-related protein [Macrococcus caseolyticus]MEB8171518.1 SpaA isopeptide-forming pilin-related protein [Macrococcus caseolyticus]